MHGPVDARLAELGLHTFPVPLDLPPLVIGMAWHPRTDADPAHRWFRDRVRAAASALQSRRNP